ncbi:hypothetical protein AVEN_128743-1 [Araneus ventricosus]|uniref:Uncharacterized protein n=1 Tax=Araneus ventricosus TaxID=182803 RepID=A0A4Y2W053_ARAVE|nr:hypothetical protein AVEN_36760-1 [Araneus ventricosus]GBO29904.1 hypothetical protein AVEN_128743-1 [Araneus ventricosus]
MTAGIVRILRKHSFSPNPSERATLTKKVRSADEKSTTLNESGWKCRSDIRTAIVFRLKRRLGRSRIDRVNHLAILPEILKGTSLNCTNAAREGLYIAIFLVHGSSSLNKNGYQNN